MKRGLTGSYLTISSVGGEQVKAFIPKPLPPAPSLQLTPELQELYDRALLSIGSLNSLSTFLPDPDLFIYSYIRKEALLSSQIEGTQSSLDEILLYESEEAPGIPMDDIQEVINYVRALTHGLSRLKENFPVSNRLIREIHGVLLSKGRGSEKDPGEFRRSQNWIKGDRPGNALFVPPPPEQVQDLMGDLEKFLHNQPQKTPALIKAALTHVQFETIHPFLDGNGRLGRLLIALILFTEGVLSEPLLYISLYFKTHRQRYYDLLQAVRIEGDWEAWLEFFLAGVTETSGQAVQTAKNLVALFDQDREKIKTLKKAANSALRVHHEFQRRPLLSIPEAVKRTGLSFPTVSASMKHLEKLGIVRGLERRIGKKKSYSYPQYIKVLSEGTEPIP